MACVGLAMQGDYLQARGSLQKNEMTKIYRYNEYNRKS